MAQAKNQSIPTQCLSRIGHSNLFSLSQRKKLIITILRHFLIGLAHSGLPCEPLMGAWFDGGLAVYLRHSLAVDFDGVIFHRVGNGLWTVGSEDTFLLVFGDTLLSFDCLELV